MNILKHIARIDVGHQLRTQVIEVPESHELLIQMKNVSIQNGVDWSTCTPTRLPGRKEPQWLNEGDIIVVARGFNFIAAHIGAVPEGYQAVAAPAFFVLSQIHECVLPEYLTWWLNQTPTQRYFDQSAEGAGTKSLKRTAFEKTPIVIPSIEQQTRIVSLVQLLQQEHRVIEQLQKNATQLQNTIVQQLIHSDVHT